MTRYRIFCADGRDVFILRKVPHAFGRYRRHMAPHRVEQVTE